MGFARGSSAGGEVEEVEMADRVSEQQDAENVRRESASEKNSRVCKLNAKDGEGSERVSAEIREVRWALVAIAKGPCIQRSY